MFYILRTNTYWYCVNNIYVIKKVEQVLIFLKHSLQPMWQHFRTFVAKILCFDKERIALARDWGLQNNDETIKYAIYKFVSVGDFYSIVILTLRNEDVTYAILTDFFVLILKI